MWVSFMVLCKLQASESTQMSNLSHGKCLEYWQTDQTFFPSLPLLVLFSSTPLLRVSDHCHGIYFIK